jgi:dTDP-4-dehydrorhamnose reductase
VSWAQLACRAAELAGLDGGLVGPRPGAALGLTAARPRYSVLGSERGTLLPPLEDALARYFAARAARQRAA